eukprot:COSAG02_NODE_1336_length_13186_cov_3.900657_4_plen_60_part_00
MGRAETLICARVNTGVDFKAMTVIVVIAAAVDGKTNGEMHTMSLVEMTDSERGACTGYL